MKTAGLCSVCEGGYLVNRTGGVRAHKRASTSGHQETCPGSGRFPVRRWTIGDTDLRAERERAKEDA